MKLLYIYRRVKDEFALWLIKFHISSSGPDDLSPHFFLLSSGRSGSTLFRKLLMENSNVHIPPESNDLLPQSAQLFHLNPFTKWSTKVDRFISLIMQMKLNTYWQLNLDELRIQLNALPKSRQNYKLVIDTLYKLSAINKNQVGLIGDKSPYLALRWQWLKTLFPNAKFIYLLRDGRDVVISRMQAFDESIDEASDRWLWAIKELAKIQKEGASLHLVKYEELVKNPTEILDATLGYLGLMKSNMVEEQQLGDDSLLHHENLQKPVFADSVGRWKNELTEATKNKLKFKLGRALTKFGYDKKSSS